MKRLVLVAISATVLITALVFIIALRGRPAVRPGPGPEPEAGRYRESPILRERVERGELPPVEERLPENPLVVEPIEGIGRYDSDPPATE